MTYREKMTNFVLSKASEYEGVLIKQAKFDEAMLVADLRRLVETYRRMKPELRRQGS